MNPFESYDVDVELEFFDGSGNPSAPLSLSQSRFTVPSGGTVSVGLPGSQNPTLSAGSVVAVSDGPIEGFARFRASGRAWLGANGTVTMEANQSFRLAFQALIGAKRTYFSVRNPSPDEPVHVQISLLSAGGRVLEEKSDIYIGPNGLYLNGLHAVFPAYRTDRQEFTGTVIIESLNDSPISEGAFQIENREVSGLPAIRDWKDDWARIADELGRDTTLGQLLKFLGINE